MLAEYMQEERTPNKREQKRPNEQSQQSWSAF